MSVCEALSNGLIISNVAAFPWEEVTLLTICDKEVIAQLRSLAMDERRGSQKMLGLSLDQLMRRKRPNYWQLHHANTTAQCSAVFD